MSVGLGQSAPSGRCPTLRVEREGMDLSERDAAIKAAVLAGKMQREIAESLGVDKSTIGTVVRRLQFTPEERVVLEANYAENRSRSRRLTSGERLHRFIASIEKPGGEDACWMWTGYIRPDNGYGVCSVPGPRSEGAHRVAWFLWNGPIPDGMVLDHTCHNADLSCPGGPGCLHRRCVNPAHLEPVTHIENWTRGRSPGPIPGDRKECSRGHPWVEGNIRVQVVKSGAVRQACRQCVRESQERYVRERTAVVRAAGWKYAGASNRLRPPEGGEPMTLAAAYHAVRGSV